MAQAINSLVIGAGIVGVACARSLALAGREVLLLERLDSAGQVTSSRNSEVLHAGIYYEPGSLKARLCVAGRELTYGYCEQKAIAHRRIGKLIVATDHGQSGRLEEIAARATANGVNDLQWLDPGTAIARAPGIRCESALFSPSTGIVDSHALLYSLLGDFEDAGGLYAQRAEVIDADSAADATRIVIDSMGELSTIDARLVVNAAGLNAPALARLWPASDTTPEPPTRWARGAYMSYSGRHQFQHLVYPLPVAGGLGIHATLDLAGNLRFGPDVEWVDRLDYDLDAGMGERFCAAIRDYWPAVERERLVPAYAGIRPKIHGPDVSGFQDFAIRDRDTGSAAQIIDLLGIESPGLTSALAIGEYVSGLARGR